MELSLLIPIAGSGPKRNILPDSLTSLHLSKTSYQYRQSSRYNRFSKRQKTLRVSMHEYLAGCNTTIEK
jgi:hypothetical protein